MIRKLALAAATALALGGTAQAAMVDYAELFGGATFEPNLDWNGGSYSMDTGFNVGATFGWWVAPQFALETEVMYTQSDYSCCSTSLETFSLMVNGVYNFEVDGLYKPYIGIGVGGIQSTYDFNSGNNSDFVFGYQGFVGVNYRIDTAENIDLFFEYRYQGGDDANDVNTWEYQSHNAQVGLRFNL